MTNTQGTKRAAPGAYEMPDGSRVLRAYAESRTTRQPVARGWNLIDPNGEWVNWFWTKGEAVEAWQKARA